MTTSLQIIELGNPILRQKSESVKDFKDPKIKELISKMMGFVMEINGVGLSPVQVGVPVRFFIMASHPNIRYPNAPQMEPTVVFNPKIISYSKEKGKDWEGCLSIPGIRATVPRNTRIKVEYTNHHGQIVSMEYTDFVARIFQHEYDHLEGLVFLDRIESNKDIVSEKEYQKIMKGSNG